MNLITQSLSNENKKKIHELSLRILSEVGIRFNADPALELFKKHGIKTAAQTVFLNPQTIEAALSTVPPTFTLEARNPDHSIVIGGEHHQFGPGYGAPFVLESDGSQRDATMTDYDNFCKLAHSSPYLDFLGSIMVQPGELDPISGHLDMLMSNFTLTDKATMGSTASPMAARDSLNMAKIIFNSLDRPVVLGLINSLSPLQYAEDMTLSLMEYAGAGQPVIIHGGAMMGSTCPITEAGTQALQNAMNLAGICLTQLVNPGTPVVYGAGGTPLDMKTGGYSIGSPELARCVAAHAAMGRHYHLPTRAGGAFTDSLVTDFQAGVESSLLLGSAAASGVNLSLHCCGILGSYIGMSYEKFMVDEELCGMVKKMVEPADYTEEAFAFDLIKEIGIGGQYLTHIHTMKRCRSAFFQNQIFNKDNQGRWWANGGKWSHEKASEMVSLRLEAYEKPYMDNTVKGELKKYIHRKR